MSRYGQDYGSASGSSDNDNDYDDKTLKLQEFSTVGLTFDGLNFSSHQQYGDSLIVNYSDAEVLDGIVFQRDDKPGTWKIFGAGDLGFNLNPDDGLPYEEYDPSTGEYSGRMTAQDVLDHPRVQGLSEEFGGNRYYYTPVGVVIEEAGEVAVNDDLDVETSDKPSIEVGEASMLLGNRSWVRQFAKLVMSAGDDAVATFINDDGDERQVGDDHDWLTTDNPELREELAGRETELFIIENSFTPEGEDEEVTYLEPILLDSKTGERITIDNGDAEEADDAEEAETAADGGTVTADTTDDSETAEPETTDDPDGGDDELSNVPDVLDDLIDYLADNEGGVDASTVRDFGESEVDDPDAVDWEAAAEETQRRA